ncbi:NAD(P)H dehydrogenase [Hyaloraphidium curvatum]|nr:NAD(P)H dehydrogenase [Hyaloraphidium curvatum]
MPSEVTADAPAAAAPAAPDAPPKRVLAVFCHTLRTTSFSGALLDAACDALRNAGHKVDVLDLHAEGFDPRFALADFAQFEGAAMPPDVLDSQAQLAAADALLFVAPVYWWSFPAMLKGWIDRVFSDGWAYNYSGKGGSKGLLADRPTLILMPGAASRRTYEKYTYDKGMAAGIDIGIFGYCGIGDVELELLLDVDDAAAREKHLVLAREKALALVDPGRKPRKSGVPSLRPNDE